MMNFLSIIFVFGILSSHSCSCKSPADANIDICPSTSTEFNLFNRKNEKGEKVSPNKDDLLKSSFDPEKPNKYLIHGFLDSPKNPSLKAIKDAYLKQGDYNIWLIDWSTIASPLTQYDPVLESMENVGECIADFVRIMFSTNENSKNVSHMIGHSLGAHMAGYVAQHLAYHDYKLARITGLDPAGPHFGDYNKKNRKLKKGDALFVDIIHTNGNRFGEKDAMGDIDFYVSGGLEQPGCSWIFLEKDVCSHNRVIEYFLESITTDPIKGGFYGYHCNDIFAYIRQECTNPKPPFRLMGDGADKMASGTFMVMINDEAPYAMGPITDVKKIIEKGFQILSNDSKSETFLKKAVVNEPFNNLEVEMSTHNNSLAKNQTSS